MKESGLLSLYEHKSEQHCLRTQDGDLSVVKRRKAFWFSRKTISSQVSWSLTNLISKVSGKKIGSILNTYRLFFLVFRP
jgi:hypothetical protein